MAYERRHETVIPSGIRPDLCSHPISPPQVYTEPGAWPQRAVCAACGANVTRDRPLGEWVRETADLSGEIPQPGTEFGRWWRGGSRWGR